MFCPLIVNEKLPTSHLTLKSNFIIKLEELKIISKNKNPEKSSKIIKNYENLF